MAVDFLSILTAVAIGSQAVGRIIPDDKKGPLGVVRQVAKVIGLYVPNQVSSAKAVEQQTVDPSVAKSIAQVAVAEAAPAIIESTKSQTAQVAESVAFEVAGKLLDDNK